MNGEKGLRDVVPFELTNRPVTELISNRKFTVEGCKGIAEYSEISIKINTVDGLISAYGNNLNISLLSTTAVIVEGYINRIEFEEWR